MISPEPIPITARIAIIVTMWLIPESLALVVLLGLTTTLLVQQAVARSSIPLVNPRKPFELGYAKARQRCLANMSGFIQQGLEKASVLTSLCSPPENVSRN
ncbi:uncharacterized protein LDX57_000007 [Aspergillus melleus]|uniref:uncharacterized protein n=1 Tax=Aspergillus melleus TaxID=138277 RepID=UPI001E8EEC2E|nr:uncharacterized protein LDX57_000007 [Aspergillus melleus]KAH8422249.1 hypothetical protein LDX57_000007 [Aspergillus melleus]